MSVKVFSGNRMIDTVNGSVIEKKISILVENEIIVAIDSPDKISTHPLFENSEKIELSGTILPGLVDSIALSIPSFVIFKVSASFLSGSPMYTVLDKAQ